MRLNEIITWERHVAALEARLCSLLEPGHREALEQTRNFAAEIRHFAVCIEDVAGMQNQSAVKQREESIARLLRTFTPE